MTEKLRDLLTFPFELAGFIVGIILTIANALFPAVFLLLSVILAVVMWWFTHFWKRSRISWQVIYFCMALIFPISLFAHSLNNIFRFIFSQIGHVFILIDIDVLILSTILDSFPFIMVLMIMTIFSASLIYLYSSALPAHFGQILSIAQFMFFLLYSIICICFKFSGNLFSLINFEFPTISLILFAFGYIVCTVVFLLPLGVVMGLSIVRLKMNVIDAFLTAAAILFLIILFGLWTALSLGLDILSTWLIGFVSPFGALIVEVFKIVPAFFSCIKLIGVTVTTALIELVFLYLTYALSERYNKNKRATKKPKIAVEERLKDQKIAKSNPSTPTPKTPVPSSAEGDMYNNMNQLEEKEPQGGGFASGPSASDPFNYNFVADSAPAPTQPAVAAPTQPLSEEDFYKDVNDEQENNQRNDLTQLRSDDYDSI